MMHFGFVLIFCGQESPFAGRRLCERVNLVWDLPVFLPFCRSSWRLSDGFRRLQNAGLELCLSCPPFDRLDGGGIFLLVACIFTVLSMVLCCYCCVNFINIK